MITLILSAALSTAALALAAATVIAATARKAHQQQGVPVRVRTKDNKRR